MHQQWLFPDILSEPGLYLIRSGQRPLYFNWNNDLLGQVKRHIEVAGEEMVPRGSSKAWAALTVWLTPGCRGTRPDNFRRCVLLK